MDELSEQIEKALIREFERELSARIRRAAGLNYSKIIGDHYFAPASWECLRLYRDGFFLGAIMAVQALVERLVKFVAERSKRNFKGELEDLVRDLKDSKTISDEATCSTLKVWRHRNDFHHLNHNISNIDLEVKAKECIEGLCALEEELFGGQIHRGTLIPRNPQFWDISKEGTAPVSLRQFNV